jgi:hypothetical protein
MQEPIIRLRNLQLQRPRCQMLCRALFESKENIFKARQATRGVVNFYSAGVVNHDRRDDSWPPVRLSNSMLSRLVLSNYVRVENAPSGIFKSCLNVPKRRIPILQYGLE